MEALIAVYSYHHNTNSVLKHFGGMNKNTPPMS